MAANHIDLREPKGEGTFLLKVSKKGELDMQRPLFVVFFLMVVCFDVLFCVFCGALALLGCSFLVKCLVLKAYEPSASSASSALQRLGSALRLPAFLDFRSTQVRTFSMVKPP